MDNKEKNFMSAVVYVHNDEKNIYGFLEMIIRFMEENFENSEIICVNDFSEDNSANVIKKCSEKVTHTTISILNMSYYHGLETAMNAGVDLSIGDFVLEFDSIYLDYNSDKIMQIYYKALEGFDIVSASPESGQSLSSSLFYYIFNRFAFIYYDMVTERFRILSRRVINRIGSMNKSIPYRKAAYNSCGLKTYNMKYQPESNAKSMKKDSKEKNYRIRLASDSLILFTNVGYRFSVNMTLLMMLVAFLVSVYSVIVYLVGDPVEGWTTTIVFLSFAFFCLFGILSIIIKYLQILVDMVFKRKKYSFESVEKITK